MLTTEGSCSANHHIDCESAGILAIGIILIIMLTAHLCDLVQWGGPPSHA